VIDEPFYAYYLNATGKKHPAADEVIATGETDWREDLRAKSNQVGNEVRLGKLLKPKGSPRRVRPVTDWQSVLPRVRGSDSSARTDIVR